MNLTNRKMYDKDQVAEWKRKAEALDMLETLVMPQVEIDRKDGMLSICWYSFTSMRWSLAEGKTLLEAVESIEAARDVEEGQ